MASFDLDLRAVENELDEVEDVDGRVILGVLDGSTAGSDWVDAVSDGNVLVLNVEGDLNELAADFARDVRDMGGHLVHFRGFLVISPPEIVIDNDRLK